MHPDVHLETRLSHAEERWMGFDLSVNQDAPCMSHTVFVLVIVRLLVKLKTLTKDSFRMFGLKKGGGYDFWLQILKKKIPKKLQVSGNLKLPLLMSYYFYQWSEYGMIPSVSVMISLKVCNGQFFKELTCCIMKNGRWKCTVIFRLTRRLWDSNQMSIFKIL